MTDPAAGRFAILSLVRLAGAVAVAVGLVVSAGRVASVPVIVGWPLVLLGVAGFLLAPRWLARRWRTRD